MNAKLFAVRMLDRSGAARALSGFFGGRGVIFGLHRIVESGQPSLMPGNDISDELLAQTLEFLKSRGYDLIPLQEVPARLKSPNGRRFAAFTFDDGFRDNLTRGLPLMQSFNAPFTICPVTGVLDGMHVPWWVVLEQLILKSNSCSFDYPDSGRRDFDCRTWQTKVSSYNELSRWGFRNPAQFTEALRSACEQAGTTVAEICSREMLSWDEMRQMIRSPLVTFGVHTESHTGLTRLNDEEVAHEIGVPKQRMEKELGTRISAIAYPFGWSGDREFRIAADCGLTVGVTTRRRTVQSKHVDHPLALPRIMPSMASHAGNMSFVRASVYGLWNEIVNRLEPERTSG